MFDSYNKYIQTHVYIILYIYAIFLQRNRYFYNYIKLLVLTAHHVIYYYIILLLLLCPNCYPNSVYNEIIMYKYSYVY